MPDKNLLRIENLSISFEGKKGRVEIIHNSSFQINKNEIVGIVGESGSGKSVTSLAIMGLLPKKTSFVSGTIEFLGQNILNLKEKEFQKVRGNEISMIFQEPMSALNPSLTCGFQVAEVLQNHTSLSSSEVKKETIALFKKVKLPRPDGIYSSYPHQISGGQMQRVMIAMAIACKPKLLLADEPTTALDVTVQKEILQLLKELQQETGMSLIFISHDLSLVSEIADRVLVLYKGDLVEEGTVTQIFKSPKADYTKALLASRPTLGERLEQLPTIASLADNSFKKVVVTPSLRALQHKKIYTLGKTILQLEKATKGSIYYRGKDLTKLSKQDIRKLRKEIQLIFQDPYSSLNPRTPIGEALMEPMVVHNIETSARKRKLRVQDLLNRVGLDETYFHRYPHELSGGQRQRVGIARTIAMEPKLVICDESVSALDISVQAQVLNLLNELKEDFGFTYIFISHDLAVVKFMADQLLVMNQGKIEELGDADEIYANPTKEYTKKLIDAIPKGI